MGYKTFAMDKKDFQLLLRRYRNGKCTEDEIQKVDLWFDKIDDSDLELNEFERGVIRNEILKELQSAIEDRGSEKNKEHRLFSYTFLKVAAVLTVFLSAGYYLLFISQSFSERTSSDVINDTDLIVFENLLSETKSIQLPDGSFVSLQPGSKLSYQKQWDEEKREVYLEGEAFFEIIKERKRPFFVHGGDIVTKVLGTSFLVRALPNAKSVEVKVRTGKVSVYKASLPTPSGSQPIRNGVILTPNQQVKYFKENNQWVTGLVEEPKPLRTIEESRDFVFDDASLRSIIAQIEKDFSIQIIVEQEAIYSCTFTGDVSKLELFDMLEVIGKSTGATFEVKGTMILINGKGCE